jgi:hypothetical protein
MKTILSQKYFVIILVIYSNSKTNELITNNHKMDD